ncbi:MAG: tetratricopeptide repeat protein [Duncaniella sp.]|nr:tetratricopeptide repeat protein [Duncaniella sp.]
MKKICVLTLGLLAAASMSAQTATVKEAEKAFKNVNSYSSYQNAVKAITPAFSNAETSANAQTYWIPGKAGFKLYDDMYGQKVIGKDVNLDEMGSALLDGYNYSLKALSLDTVTDAKGKVKTKFSKDIAATIASHHADFANSGSGFWDSKNYPKAYEAFMAYINIPGNASLGQSAPKALADSVAAQMAYYAGLAAWQAEMLPEAARAFEQMMALGYDEMAAYDYAYSVAYQMNDESKKLEYSKIAYDKFGSEKPEFLQRIISSYMAEKKYDDAMSMLETAIKNDPTNGTNYYLIGVLYDDKGEKEKSQESFKKAVEIDPNNAMANFSYGTALIQQYERLDEKTGDMSQGEYNKYKAENMNPLLKEAAVYLEKAYELDNEMTNALTNLKIVYYNLNDGANLDRVEKLLL